MQGLIYHELAKVITDERYEHTSPHSPAPRTNRERTHKTRQWAGRKLIRLGERLVPKHTDLQLKVSTGPPSP
jgi:hypothetical protein